MYSKQKYDPFFYRMDLSKKEYFTEKKDIIKKFHLIVLRYKIT